MKPVHYLTTDEFYRDRPVEHVAQGDLYDGVPFYCTSGSRVASDRPDPQGVETYANADHTGIGVVCSYTRGLLASAGRRGYAHPYRLMAPLLTFDELARRGLEEKDLGILLEWQRSDGFMYVPHPRTHEPAAVCLYRMSLVHQNLLDELPRVARFSEAAQRVLIRELIAVVSPNFFEVDAHELALPDLDSGWDEAE